MFWSRIFSVYLAILSSSTSKIQGLEDKTVVIEAKKRLYLTCEDVNITCILKSLVYSPSVTWLFNGTNITTPEEKYTPNLKECQNKFCASLRIKCAQVNDSGDYSCRYESEEGSFNSANYFRLEVHDPVKIISHSVNVQKQPNNDVNLICEFKGQNISQISWHKKTNQDLIRLPPSYVKNITLNDHINSTLTLKGISRDANGTYICNADDGKSNASQEVSLFVLDIPRLTLHMVTATGSRTVFMNWTLDDGNSPVTQYIVKFLKKGTTEWKFYDEYIGGGNTSFIIKKLEPNTTYSIRIIAKNNIGESDLRESPPVTTLSFDPHFVPEVSVKSVGPSSINVGWTPPPESLMNHIHYFKVLFHDKNVTKESIVHLKSDSYLVYAFTDLHSATTYQFQVAACNEFTNDCGNWSNAVSETTLDGMAEAPENVTIECVLDPVSNVGAVQLTWLPPKNPNGKIVHYIAAIQGSASYIDEYGGLSYSTYGPRTITVKNETWTVKFQNLPPNTNYTISVSAVTRTRDSGDVTQRYCMMPPAVPNRDNLLKFDWDKIEDRGQYMFKLLKPKLSERNGVICCFRVFVVKLKPQQSIQQLPTPGQNPIYSYEYVYYNADGGTYMADVLDKEFINKEVLVGDEHIANSTKCTKCPVTTKTSLPPSDSLLEPTNVSTTGVFASTSVPSEQQFFHYSSSKLMADPNGLVAESDDVANKGVLPYDGPLDVHSNYTGYIQLIVFGKDNFIPAYSHYFKILKPGPQYDGFQVNEFGAIFFQILCGMTAIFIVAMAAFCLLQRYTKQVAETQGVEMTLRNSFRHLCRSLRGSHVPVSSNPPDVYPISKTALLAAFAELAKDSDYGFEQEFELLPDRFTDRTTKASEARENQSKNRYPDIKAYDQTRVKLSQIDGILGSDYINANFVMCYKERKKFICAQGPMDNTVCDFWRMIWEQHLELVLMLTNLEEYSKTKCAKYWPDKEEKKKIYNDITIHYLNEKRYSDYVIRELKMMRNTIQNRDPEERIIFQYHFLMWKDFQAPEYSSGILKFIWRVNEAYSLEKGPILVHCSAGVGRTGTLVAIDSLLQQLDSEGHVLIFNTICDLRHQRNFLVQSLKQYIFVYRALVEYAHFGYTEIKASNLKATIEKWKKTDNGKLKTPMEEEYDKLSFTISSHEHKSMAVASAAENAAKNRSSFIIPYDKNRVILTPIPGREHSTYINATFIEGYDNMESFIITQDPILDVTVIDFWRMISELNISTIVMLSSTPATSDGQKRLLRYWPDDETIYGNVNLKHVESESCPYYTRREFYLQNVKSDENLVVTQYQYNGWPTVEGEVPEVTRGLIELMDNATQNAESTGLGPIVVHCEYGGDRSSMFVALCILAQQLKVERRVDVVTTARKLRSQRQGMLTSFAQYEFLYRAILNYVDLHHLFDAETN